MSALPRRGQGTRAYGNSIRRVLPFIVPSTHASTESAAHPPITDALREVVLRRLEHHAVRRRDSRRERRQGLPLRMRLEQQPSAFLLDQRELVVAEPARAHRAPMPSIVPARSAMRCSSTTRFALRISRHPASHPTVAMRCASCAPARRRRRHARTACRARRRGVASTVRGGGGRARQCADSGNMHAGISVGQIGGDACRIGRDARRYPQRAASRLLSRTLDPPRRMRSTTRLALRSRCSRSPRAAARHRRSPIRRRRRRPTPHRAPHSVRVASSPPTTRGTPTSPRSRSTPARRRSSRRAACATCTPTSARSYGIPYRRRRQRHAEGPHHLRLRRRERSRPVSHSRRRADRGRRRPTGDRHVLVVDTRRLEALRAVRRAPAERRHELAAPARAPCSICARTRCARRYWTSADAAGLPIFPGLVRYDEAVTQRHDRPRAPLHLPRARAAATSRRRATTRAATRRRPAADGDARAPQGRLRQSAASRRASHVILRAMKKYGMFLADNGADGSSPAPRTRAGRRPPGRAEAGPVQRVRGGEDGNGDEVVRCPGARVPPSLLLCHERLGSRNPPPCGRT